MTDDNEYRVRQVPKDESGRLELLATRPPLWEYLLFGNVLYTSRAAHEERWRDYELGYGLRVGPVIESRQIPNTMSERLSHANAILGNLERIVAPAAQERAFGKPGEPGNPALIEHMGVRLIDLYALLLGWAEETMALRVPDWAEQLKRLLTAFVSQPLQRTHGFVDEYISQLERAISNLAEGSDTEEITIHLTFEVDDDLVRNFHKELGHVKRRLRTGWRLGA